MTRVGHESGLKAVHAVVDRGLKTGGVVDPEGAIVLTVMQIYIYF